MTTPTLRTGTTWYDKPHTPDPHQSEPPVVVFDKVPYWLGYLLWFDRQESCWVLEVSDGDSLLSVAENRALSTIGDLAAAQAWVIAHDTDTGGRSPIGAWHRIAVWERSGWAAIDDIHYRRNALYHDLHPPTADPKTCCTWGSPHQEGGRR